MIKIEVSELKSFLDKAKKISANNLLHIYEFLKLECIGDTATFSKHNGHAFVASQIKAQFKKDITILIDSKTINAVVNKASGKTITIKVKKEVEVDNEMQKIIEITDGVTPVEFYSPSAALYLEYKKPATKGAFSISADVLITLGYAMNIAEVNRTTRTWFTYIHIKRVDDLFYIFSTNGSISLFKGFKETLPEISLDPESVDALAGLTEVLYSSVDNYDVFDAGATVYGFIKTEIKCRDINQYIKMLDTKKHFIVDRHEIIDFFELVESINPSSVVPEVLVKEDDKKSISLYFESFTSNRKAQRTIETDKKNMKAPDFKCQSKSVLTLFKNMSYEKVQFNGPVSGHYFITTPEDADYIGVLQQIIYPQDPVATTNAKTESTTEK